MDHKDEHKDNILPKGLKEEIFSQTAIPFEKSKDDVWASLSGQLDDSRVVEVSTKRLPAMLYVAASLAILITTITLYMRFHSLEYTTKDELAEISLPDGSSIKAGSNTLVSYHPHWWRFHREVKLRGDAYFDVEPGKRFSVLSPSGITEVLGTTFTIVDRSDLYKVSCYTGSVSVQATNSDVAATLMANEEVLLDKDGNYNVRLIPLPKTDHKITEEEYFMFNSTSVLEVFRQLEEKYSIQIVLSEEMDFVYSGHLSRDLQINDILTAVCMPLGLNYEQTSDNIYTIIPE